MRKRIVTLIPLVALIVVWEILSHVIEHFTAFFSSPSAIVVMFVDELIHGDLLYHISVTALESFVGLFFGLVVGCAIGFSPFYYPKFSSVAYPYVVALSAIPTFAIAPLMIIWFGTGIIMKIVLAFLATVFITAFQAYEGARKVSVSDQLFFQVNKATKKQSFWMLSFPSSLDWVIQSLKLNSGFCILGAFIGEYIASEQGIGYMIFKMNALSDATYVFVGVICLVLLSSFYSIIASEINKNRLAIIRFVTRSTSLSNKSEDPEE